MEESVMFYDESRWFRYTQETSLIDLCQVMRDYLNALIFPFFSSSGCSPLLNPGEIRQSVSYNKYGLLLQ